MRIVDSPRAVAERANCVVLSLPNSNVVEDVIFGTDGILASKKQDIQIIDTTTGDPLKAPGIAERVENAGCGYMDICILGSSQQVADGDVVAIAGARERQLVRYRSLAGHIRP